jgi:hypothetical protein
LRKKAPLTTRQILSRSRITVTSTPIPNYDKDAAVTTKKPKAPSRAAKAKGALHPVRPFKPPTAAEDLTRDLYQAKVEARKVLDSVKKTDVDAYLAAVHDFKNRIKAIDAVLNDNASPMPPADQRTESPGAGPSSSPPTTTAITAKILQNLQNENKKTTQVPTAPSADNRNVEQLSTPLPPIPAFFSVIPATPASRIMDTVMVPAVDRFRENTITKDLIQAPRFQLPDNKKLSSHTDLLLLIEHDSKLKQHVERKLWSPVVEAWVLEQVLEGSTAHSKITASIRSITTNTPTIVPSLHAYFAHVFLVFFKNKDIMLVIEEHMQKITLDYDGRDDAVNRRTTLGFCNRYQDLASYAPANSRYPEQLLIAKIRLSLPPGVQKQLKKMELHDEHMLNIVLALEPALNRLDQDHQTDRAASKKRTAPSNDSDISAMDTDHSEHQQKRVTFRAADTKHPSICTHCNKKGHISANCWKRFPEKLPERYRKANGKPQHKTSENSQFSPAQLAQLSAMFENLPKKPDEN